MYFAQQAPRVDRSPRYLYCTTSRFLPATQEQRWAGVHLKSVKEIGISMRMKQNKLNAVLTLAVLSFISSIVILFLPLGNKKEELSERATLSTAISTSFALVSGIVAILATAWISSSDYQAEEAVKADTTKLLACLRSIMLKGAVLSQRPDDNDLPLDFKQELEIIEHFLLSTTAFAYWSWEGYKSEASEGSSEEWRVFFLYLVDILGTKPQNYRSMIARAVSIEKLLTSLKEEDIRKVSSYLTNLSEAAGKFRESREKSVLINAVSSIYGQKRDSDITCRMFLHLKRKGVQDPNIDLFLAFLMPDGNVEQAREALAAGADLNLTDSQLLNKYRKELEDFISAS